MVLLSLCFILPLQRMGLAVRVGEFVLRSAQGKQQLTRKKRRGHWGDGWGSRPVGSYKGPVAVSILVMNLELLLFPRNQAIQVLTLCWLQWLLLLDACHDIQASK